MPELVRIDKKNYTQEIYEYDFAANGVFIRYEDDEIMIVDQSGYVTDVIKELEVYAVDYKE